MLNNKHAQGLPISTIIIIILVILVLVAVGIFFFTQFSTGGNVASQTSSEVAEGGEQLIGVDWAEIGGTSCKGTATQQYNCNSFSEEPVSGKKLITSCKALGCSGATATGVCNNGNIYPKCSAIKEDSGCVSVAGCTVS